MNIFLSHAQSDSELALRLAEKLRALGAVVFHAETDIGPGENWAKKVGAALQDANFIVFLLTPVALQSEWVRKEIEYAIGSKKYDGRVFSVFVGPTLEAGKEVPWILLKLPHRQVESAREFNEVAREIDSLCAEASSANG